MNSPSLAALVAVARLNRVGFPKLQGQYRNVVDAENPTDCMGRGFASLGAEAGKQSIPSLGEILAEGALPSPEQELDELVEPEDDDGDGLSEEGD